MRKKTALVLTSLLMLTAILTMPLYTPQPGATLQPRKWKVTLAQKNCNANATGWLTFEHEPVAGFCLKCVCGDYVYTKVESDLEPNDIHFTLSVDWAKDGIWEYPDQEDYFEFYPITIPFQFEKEIIFNMTLVSMDPVNWEDPECTLWHEDFPAYSNMYHLQDWQDQGSGVLDHCDYVWLNLIEPPVEWCTKQKYHVEQVEDLGGGITALTVSQKKMVAIEVEELEYSPVHEWQVTLLSKPNVTADFFGGLTKDGIPIDGTAFDLHTYHVTNTTFIIDMDCTVVKTPWCVIPNDIYWTCNIDWDNDGIIDYPDEGYEWLNQTSLVGPQYPWKRVINGPDDKIVELEVTQVQMYKYNTMGGIVASCVQIGGRNPDGSLFSPPGYWASPFQSRAMVWPYQQVQNVTFEQMDPISGVVKMGIPAEGYGTYKASLGRKVGLDQTYFSARVGTFFRVTTYMLEQGVGWIFTGQGKDPITADVDLITFNNDTGVFTYGPDGLHTPPTTTGVDPDGTWADDEPCIPNPNLQEMSGVDGIPGTGDPGDVFGDGTSDPAGSAVMYMPLILHVYFYTATGWHDLFASPWPQVFTTGVANDTVIECGTAEHPCWFNGETVELEGEPYEYVNSGTPWKNPDCNIWSKMACAWSVLRQWTALDYLDVLFCTKVYNVREDWALWGDVDRSGKVDWMDMGALGLAYGAGDEKEPFTTVASSRYNAYCDFDCNDKVDWMDQGLLGLHYGDDYRGHLQTAKWPMAAYGSTPYWVNDTIAGGPIYANVSKVTIDLSGSSDTDGTILFYMGAFFNQSNPFAPMAIGFAAEKDPLIDPLMFVVHELGDEFIEEYPPGVFPRPGVYTVYLYVVDSDGLYASPVPPLVLTVIPPP